MANSALTSELTSAPVSIPDPAPSVLMIDAVALVLLVLLVVAAVPVVELVALVVVIACPL
jgi:hypothetical protein